MTRLTNALAAIAIGALAYACVVSRPPEPHELYPQRSSIPAEAAYGVRVYRLSHGEVVCWPDGAVGWRARSTASPVYALNYTARRSPGSWRTENPFPGMTGDEIREILKYSHGC